MTSPTVTAIIPTYNRAWLVRDSITSLLTQTVPPLEIIVVDDGSSDNTGEVIASFGDKVRHITQPNGGAAAARNTGIKLAQGDLITFLDHDDLCLPRALEARIERFQDPSAPPVEIVMGMTQRVALVDGHEVFDPWAARLFGAAMVRREVFDRVGLLDEALLYGEDVDWFLRVREHTVPLVFLQEITLHYRIHKDSLMSDTRLAKLYLLQVLKKSLARRAAANGGVVKPMAEMTDLQDLMRMMQELKG